MAEFDITAKITAALREYTEDVTEGVNREAERCAEGLRKDLRQDSPKKTGDYASTWQKKKTGRKPGGCDEFTVYNDKNYQLTHLLEHPHAGPYGYGLVSAKPHIGKAEKKWNLDFEESVEEVVAGEK